jgi:hypothetical protein
MAYYQYILIAFGLFVGLYLLVKFYRYDGAKVNSPLAPLPEKTPEPIVEIKEETIAPTPIRPKLPEPITLVQRLNFRYEFADVKLWQKDGKAILLWKNAIGKRMQNSLNVGSDHRMFVDACNMIEDSLHDLKRIKIK